MNALERTKLALRAYIQANKEKVAADLEDMRQNSEGRDIYSYIDNFSDAFSFEIETSCSVISMDNLLPELESYSLLNELIDHPIFSPPKSVTKKYKKDSEIISESFFLIILHYDRSTTSGIFV